MYDRLRLGVPMSQGDVIDDCPLFSFDPTSPIVDLDAAPLRWQVRVVVLTQACDLAQGKSSRVLVAPVHTAQGLVTEGLLTGPQIRDQVRRQLVYGWYFLPAA